jgi:hypothetical protein
MWVYNTLRRAQCQQVRVKKIIKNFDFRPVFAPRRLMAGAMGAILAQ